MNKTSVLLLGQNHSKDVTDWWDNGRNKLAFKPRECRQECFTMSFDSEKFFPKMLLRQFGNKQEYLSGRRTSNCLQVERGFLDSTVFDIQVMGKVDMQVEVALSHIHMWAPCW